VARCLAQKGPFSAILRIFFNRSAATACKNLHCLTKIGHFFVSDATTLTSYEKKEQNILRATKLVFVVVTAKL
jgi:hypothetical protein